jgi:hypothetical protein
LPKSASNNLQKWFLYPTGRLNFGFITEGKLTIVLITPYSWGSQLPLTQRQSALAEISGRCRSLCWTLLLHRDMTGEVRRALTVRDATAQALLGTGSAGLNRAVAMVRNIRTSQRRLVPMSLAQRQVYSSGIRPRGRICRALLPSGISAHQGDPHLATSDPAAQEVVRPRGGNSGE